MRSLSSVPICSTCSVLLMYLNHSYEVFSVSIWQSLSGQGKYRDSPASTLTVFFLSGLSHSTNKKKTRLNVFKASSFNQVRSKIIWMHMNIQLNNPFKQIKRSTSWQKLFSLHLIFSFYSKICPFVNPYNFFNKCANK